MKNIINTIGKRSLKITFIIAVIVGFLSNAYYLPNKTLLEENMQFRQEVWQREFDSYKLVRLINSSRIKNNLNELRVNDKLIKAAYLKAEDMFEHNYFEHISPSGVEPWEWINKVNYNYSDAGENLAMNYYTAELTHQSLMSSDGHRKNILHEDFSEIGIAVISDTFNNTQTIIVVEMFGSEY